MPSEPTREELLAQVAALQAQLRARPVSPFVGEVPGKAPPHQPDKKTSQDVQPLVATPVPLALARALDPRLRNTKQTPEELLAQIGAVKSILVSGVNTAAYGDKRTEFRSLAELRQILNDLEEDLADALGMGGRIRQIRMTTQADKGL